MSDNGKRLDGKVALITGGGSGIGKGTAKRFIQEGAQVMLADISEENLAAAQQELGENSATIKMNVTVEEEVEHAVAATVQKFGRLDVMVNSAGVGTMSAILDTDAESWDDVLAVDLKGPFLCIKHAATQMIAQGDGGAIISIASLNSRQPAEGMASYCSAKAGVEMLTKVAAMELGAHKIRVNAISPGLIDTPLTNGMFGMPGVLEGFLENTPLGRYGSPDDIAAAALFLASDDASWITAETLFVDGGALTKRYPDLMKIVMGG
jgi:NAD(P)-dependent dehydrogenase (short-subunit alcohol dehydrogenase family)